MSLGILITPFTSRVNTAVSRYESDRLLVEEALAMVVRAESNYEAAEALGVSEFTVRRWRSGEIALPLRSATRATLLKAVRGVPRNQEEETPEQAAALILPDVSYLKPQARALYDQTVGSWVTRGWAAETIQQLARTLVAPIEGYNTMRKVGQGFRDLTEQDQIHALEDQAEEIEAEYGPNGVLRN